MSCFSSGSVAFPSSSRSIVSTVRSIWSATPSLCSKSSCGLEICAMRDPFRLDAEGGPATRWGARNDASAASARLLLPLRLDPSDPGGRRQDRLVPILPADADAGRVLLQDLFDRTPARRLRSSLGLDDDGVTGLSVHAGELNGCGPEAAL